MGKMVDKPKTSFRREDVSPEDALVMLLARVAVHDEAALSELYDLTSPRVHGLALRILRDPTAAAEATLDVYHQVWRQADRYAPAKGSPLGWLLMLARTRAIDLVRSRARLTTREDALEAAASLEDPSAGPEARSAAAQDATRVRRALAQLAPTQRDALVAAYFSGMSHAEVAAALGEPLGTIKTRIRTGLAQLRRLLSEPGESVA